MVGGTSFIGMRTRRAKVMYLTEERSTTFRQALARTGLLENLDLIILSKHEVPRDLLWPDLIRFVAIEARIKGIELLVVDTLAEWAGLPKNAENDSDSALGAMSPLQEASAQGLAVLVSRHDSKAGVDVGVAGRGSSAFTGAVDISLMLTRSKQGDSLTRRELQAVGRFDDTPSLLVLELRDGLCIHLGSAADAVKMDARNRILEALPDGEAHAVDEDALKKILDGSDISKGTIGSALRELVVEGEVKRIGEGKK